MLPSTNLFHLNADKLTDSNLYYEHIPGNGPPVLFAHGFLMGNDQWQPNLPTLTEFCSPVLVELFGHARSPSPVDPDAYLPTNYVAEFEAIRREIGAEQWFLCGYSLGGGLTVRYALAHPAHVIGHAFTNSSSGFADTKQMDEWREGAEQSARRIEEGGHAAMERIPVHPKFAHKLGEPLYGNLLAQAENHSPLGIANAMRYTTPNASVRQLIATNSRPALLVQGVRERRFRPLADYARAHMPHLRVAELDAGHGMNMEAPDAFNHALAEFIANP